jgi:hypothetical protein
MRGHTGLKSQAPKENSANITGLSGGAGGPKSKKGLANPGAVSGTATAGGSGVKGTAGGKSKPQTPSAVTTQGN